MSQIGDGRDTNAWEDSWLPCGPLSAFMTYRFIYSCGFSPATTIRELVMSLNGVWPDDWCARFDVLNSFPLPSLNDSIRDHVLWGDDCTSCSRFEVRNAWASLEGSYPVVPWYKSVWFSGHIPKHAFCLWLACQRRLPTQDRLLWKDEPPDLECSLCGQSVDSHAHLFFQCTFARKVWDNVLRIVDLTTMPYVWDQILETISDSNHRPKRLKQKLAVATSVYFIWQERNRRLFTGDRRNAMQIIQVIVQTLEIRVAG
ncbi:uncharacterized protein LOC112504947 [Cynara cardunculus var. scolymus]|uniref:uncharacterized protein LOC112504947 n=1 Tax=Cynara cardunculus var. scolymus TaxID=59895 RepID=UPI000D629E87|nr:uncharacterized protein LOC112504947 [Cynara cardunculus var. scolymus]